MDNVFQNRLIDCSTDTEIIFVACCENCKKKSFSIRKKFSKAGIIPQSNEKMLVYRILYKREWEKLKQKAKEGLEEQFNICPICHQMVCDDCFLICDEVDMCKNCAGMLKEEGKIVAES